MVQAFIDTMILEAYQERLNRLHYTIDLIGNCTATIADTLRMSLTPYRLDMSRDRFVTVIIRGIRDVLLCSVANQLERMVHPSLGTRDDTIGLVNKLHIRMMELCLPGATSEVENDGFEDKAPMEFSVDDPQ